MSSLSDFSAGPLPPRAVAPGTPHWTPAVHPQRGHARHLREKLAVLAAFPEDALVAQPGFDPLPALQLLAMLAAHEHPQALVVHGRHWQAPWLGWALDEAAQPIDLHGGWPELGGHLACLPAVWRHAALLALAFAEDFALIDDNDAAPCLRWGVVALPSFWAPEATLGAAPGEVPAVGHEQQSLRPCPSPRLHMHPRRADHHADAERTWQRSEHRRALRLPGIPQRALLMRVDSRPMPPA